VSADAVSPWIARFAHLIEPGASVLDVASGHGRHARHLASRGARVLAVDRDTAALAALAGTPGVETRLADLENAPWPFDRRTFDAVVVTRYLHRALFPALIGAVSPEGLLLYETFAIGNEQYGRPRNPDFLLAPGELLDVVRGRLSVLAFEEGLTVGEKPSVLQRIAAVGLSRQRPVAFIDRSFAS